MCRKRFEALKGPRPVQRRIMSVPCERFSCRPTCYQPSFYLEISKGILSNCRRRLGRSDASACWALQVWDLKSTGLQSIFQFNAMKTISPTSSRAQTTTARARMRLFILASSLLANSVTNGTQINAIPIPARTSLK